MGTVTVLPTRASRVRKKAKGLLSSVAFTLTFTLVYTALAPLAVLGALLGGPLWAALMLRHEHALDTGK